MALLPLVGRTPNCLVFFQNGTTRNKIPSFSSSYFSFHKTKTSTFQLRSSLSTSFQQTPSSFPGGLELGYISGKNKATEVAHLIWQHIVRKGDIVVDATCGNGHDTLALLKMVADESGSGRVYGMDIQNCALQNTYSLLNESVTPNEKELVKLFLLCHSRMDDIVPQGYLPGGDKAIITVPERTLQALQAASKLLGPGGLISIMVYVGHPGGREEYEVVQAFASDLLVEHWVCSKFEMLNRPAAPVLVLLFKK